jgi:hypothetical protein
VHRRGSSSCYGAGSRGRCSPKKWAVDPAARVGADWCAGNASECGGGCIPFSWPSCAARLQPRRHQMLGMRRRCWRPFEGLPRLDVFAGGEFDEEVAAELVGVYRRGGAEIADVPVPRLDAPRRATHPSPSISMEKSQPSALSLSRLCPTKPIAPPRLAWLNASSSGGMSPKSAPRGRADS